MTGPTAITKMSHGEALTTFKKGQIVAVRRDLVSIRPIAKGPHRSYNAVATFLRRYYAGKTEKRKSSFRAERASSSPSHSEGFYRKLSSKRAL